MRYSMRLVVVHEDDELVVVDKPSGILTANAPGETRDNLFDLVKEHVRGKSRRPRRVWIVHRLDKEASGLLVFAKTERAYESLKEQLRARRMHRLYTAVVEGVMGTPGPTPSSGTIQSFMVDEEFGIPRSVKLGEVAQERARADAARGRPGPRGRNWSNEPARTTLPDDPSSPKLAVTHWQSRAHGHGRTLLSVRLETGRKNQIRVHLSEAHHPIVGDHRFGASSDPLGRVALHATELGFTHPASSQSVRYRSAVPPAFYTLVGVSPPRGEADPHARAEDVDAAPAAPGALPIDPAASASAGSGEEAATGPSAPQPGASAPRDGAKDAEAAPGDTSWDAVAAWYDELIEEDRSDHFRDVIVPGTMRLLDPRRGQRILDVACGQGALCRRLAEMGVEAYGIDASARLIAAATERAAPMGERAPKLGVGDARDLASAWRTLAPDAPAGPVDAVTCVMALMNIDALAPVARGIAALLKPGGALVAVVLHPAFRAPGQTSWGWDHGPRGGGRDARDARRAPAGPRQFRRVDGYLSTGQTPITMNPGFAAHGAAPVLTWTFHRPIQAYVSALAGAGLVIDALEEWPSARRSQPGATPRGRARADEENRARREIPMFLALRARKLATPAAS